MSKEQIMQWCKEEIVRGLRLFGWASGNQKLIKQWVKEYQLTAEEENELVQYHKKMEVKPEYQFL